MKQFTNLIKVKRKRLKATTFGIAELEEQEQYLNGQQ